VTAIILYRHQYQSPCVTVSVRISLPESPRRREATVLHPISPRMSFQNRSGWLRSLATLVCLCSALPFSLLAQVRRPDPGPVGPRSSTSAPKRRSEILMGGGYVKLNELNATKASMFIGTIGFRRQVAPEWLSLGGTLDVGRTTIDGRFFPYEKRASGDSIQFVQVDGHATMVAARFTADVLFPLDEEERFRAGAGGTAGVYAMMPAPAGGAGAGTFVAPTFGASFVGEADLTRQIGLMASLGFTQFLNFDRDKLRPSDPALADAVFVTPLIPPPAAVKSFGGARVLVGITYRLGVKKTTKGAR
jgi:hypothetical protein